MAWPASQQRLVTALDRANAKALQIKKWVSDLRAQSAAGPVNRQLLLDLQAQLHIAINVWNESAAVPGIGAYAQEQFGDPALDVAGEFNAMVSETTSLRDWIHANFPRDASGAVLVHTTGVDGKEVPLTFTSAQLSEFRNRADALLATIA